MDTKVVCLFIIGAVLALSSAAVQPGAPANHVGDKTDPAGSAIVNEIYDGINLDKLTEQQLAELADAEDEVFTGELDIYLGRKSLSQKTPRHKRWIGLVGRGLFAAGRAFMRGFSRGRISRSGSRLTRQYNRRGSYQDAVRDYRGMNPSGSRPISGRNLEGHTGTMGRHRVTVRSNSSSGSPTLEIRSPSGTVRKFRYNP